MSCDGPLRGRHRPRDEDLARLHGQRLRDRPGVDGRARRALAAALSGTLHLGRTNRFFLGGGKALLNAYYRTSQPAGRHVAYDAYAEDFEFTGRALDALSSCPPTAGGCGSRPGRWSCASGGFEANLDWLRRYWGDAARTTSSAARPTTTGTCWPSSTTAGAASAGEEKGFHAIARRRPRAQVRRRHRHPARLASRSASSSTSWAALLRRGRGHLAEALRDLGSNIAGQPGQIAFSLWDAKVNGLFLPPMYGATTADDIGDLAAELGLDRDAVTSDRGRVQRGRGPRRHLRPAVLDDCHTDGLDRAEVALGAAARPAAVLRHRDAPRHHLHLHGRGGEPEPG